MDPISSAFMTFGVVLLLASWIYLIVISFREDYTWGLFTVLLPPLSYLYSLFNWGKAKDSLWLALIGLGLVILSVIA